jgi:hypothetical protein
MHVLYEKMNFEQRWKERSEELGWMKQGEYFEEKESFENELFREYLSKFVSNNIPDV